MPVESFIGIRVPVLRKFAKEFTKETECEEFLHQHPHEYYDENMLHGLLISEVMDYEECICLTDRFLPFVDNWAVYDIMSPRVFAKHKEELLAKIKTWSKSSHVYTCRFGIETLMSHYLDKDLKAEYLEIPASVRSKEYYVKIMVAKFFATALAKQWDATITPRAFFVHLFNKIKFLSHNVCKQLRLQASLQWETYSLKLYFTRSYALFLNSS